MSPVCIQAKNVFRVSQKEVFLKLTQHKEAVIDLEDFGKVASFRWCCQRIKKHCYAVAYQPASLGRKRIYLHRFLVGNKGFIDHKDSNGLNNRRSNLRVCSLTENNRNRAGYSCSGFKGVDRRGVNRYEARIRVNKHLIYLGSFSSGRKAAIAYDKAAEKYFGEFARLNLPV